MLYSFVDLAECARLLRTTRTALDALISALCARVYRPRSTSLPRRHPVKPPPWRGNAIEKEGRLALRSWNASRTSRRPLLRARTESTRAVNGVLALARAVLGMAAFIALFRRVPARRRTRSRRRPERRNWLPRARCPCLGVCRRRRVRRRFLRIAIPYMN